MIVYLLYGIHGGDEPAYPGFSADRVGQQVAGHESSPGIEELRKKRVWERPLYVLDRLRVKEARDNLEEFFESVVFAQSADRPVQDTEVDLR